MWELIGGLLMGMAKLVIPPMSAEESVQYWYRIRVSLFTAAAFCMASFAIASANGWVPGISGFAKSTELDSMVKYIIDGQLIDLRTKHCKATSDEAKQLYWSRISWLMGEYQRVTKAPYNLPACGDL